jgi:hypothetical protein
MLKSLRALPLAAVLAVAVPGTAAAATLPVTVTISGKQQSSFNQPKAYGYQDCFNKYWGEHHARRAFEFAATARGRLHTAPGGLAFFTWRGDRRAGATFLADASVTHSYDGLSGSDPGDCGGGRPTVVHRGRVCGTRKFAYDWDLEVVRDKIRIAPSIADVKQDNFDCGIGWGSCLKGGDPWGDHQEKFSLKRLRNRKTFEVTGSDKCAKTSTLGNVTTTHGGSVNWRVKMEPEGRWRRF